MKILLWSPGGVGTHYFGPAISTYRLFQSVKERHGVRLTLVHGSPEQDRSLPVLDEVVTLPLLTPSAGRAAAYAKQVRFVAVGQSWLRRNLDRFDVMFIPMSNALTLPAALSARRRGMPVIGRVAAADNELRDNGRVRTLLRWSSMRVARMRKLSRIVAISREIEDRLQRLGMPADQIVYLPNSADCQRFHPATPEERAEARRRFAIPESARLVILCVGAVTRRKGQHLIADALRILPPDVHFLMVGPDREPDYAALIREMMASTDIGGRIHRSDHIVDVEVAYRAADIFAVPSTDEGMPNALVEAMASGLAAIGTPISGITDLLAEGERGRLVRRDQAEINAALAAYSADDDLRHRHAVAARQFIVENQSRERTADRMFRLMADLVGSGGDETSSAALSWFTTK